MAESVKELVIKKADGTPTIEIVVGFALWATYKFKLWAKDGTDSDVIGNGFSGDSIDDEFKIGTVSSLNGRNLTWKVIAAGFEDGGQEQYQITILIRQKGKTVPNGVFTYSGVLDDVVAVGGFVKLKVS